MPWSRVNTKYSLHQVQDTLSTAYTKHSIHCVLHHPEIDHLPLPASPSTLGRPCFPQFSKFTQLQVNQWIQSQIPSRLPPELLPPDWPPPGTPGISLDHGVQVHLQTCSITASRCITILTRSRPTCPHHHSRQVYLHTRSIKVSKLAPSRPPRASPNLLDYRIGVHLQTQSVTMVNLVWSRHPSVSLNPLDYVLQARTITDSKGISKLTQLWSPNSLDHGVQVHLQTCWITPLQCISNFTGSWCGEMVEQEGIHPIIYTPPHVTWYPKGIREKKRF